MKLPAFSMVLTTLLSVLLPKNNYAIFLVMIIRVYKELNVVLWNVTMDFFMQHSLLFLLPFNIPCLLFVTVICINVQLDRKKLFLVVLLPTKTTHNGYDFQNICVCGRNHFDVPQWILIIFIVILVRRGLYSFIEISKSLILSCF